MGLFLFLSFLFHIQLTSNLSKTIKQSRQDHIKHVIFIKDKIFYVPESGRQFGVLSRGRGEIVSHYELRKQQSILRVDKQLNQMILRKERNNVLIFRLNSLDIQEINIEISFLHQNIIDAVQNQPDIYVVTEKDVRVYKFQDQKKGEEPKNIIASGRKKQWFKKICIQNETSGEFNLILLRGQQVCIRRITADKKYTQKCLFNVSSLITDIEPIGKKILIKSQSFNYVIQENDQVYSFKGLITQFDDNFALLTQMFKTFDFSKLIIINGIRVQGSSSQHQLFLQKENQKLLKVLYNGRYVNTIKIEDKFNGVWCQTSNGPLQLLFQIGLRKFYLYEINLSDNSINLKWSTATPSKAQEAELQPQLQL